MHKTPILFLFAALTGCSAIQTAPVPQPLAEPNPYGVVIIGEIQDAAPTSEQDDQNVSSSSTPDVYAAAPNQALDTEGASDPSVSVDTIASADPSNLDADSLYALGRQYMEGTDVDKNELIGIHYIELSAELGKDEAKRTLGLIKLKKNASDPEGLSLIQDAALSSHKAQLQLGLMYGDFADPKLHNPERAMELLSQASSGGNAAASYYLSKLYTRKGNTDLARKALRESAEAGYAHAQLELAKQSSARGAYTQAGEWFLKAAQQGDPEAMFEYANGLIIQRFKTTLGKGFKHPEEVEAYAWFKEAQAAGEPRAAPEVMNLQGVVPELARQGYDVDQVLIEARGQRSS